MVGKHHISQQMKEVPTMFMDMTIIQQLFLVFLALFLLRLALCIL